MASPSEPMAMIELRSDTFTLPTSEMLAAITSATLGDDSYREDPTVHALEALAATTVGKEAACLMPSGTMANLAALLAHALDADETRGHAVVLAGDRSDIVAYEDGTILAWAGITCRPLPTQPDGTLSLADLAASWQVSDDARIALVCLESPHNLCGGVVLPLDYLRAVAGFVHAHGAALHLDGARLFNGATQLGVEAAAIVADADSVQFCLSKGLAAPIGSMVAGSSAFIARVRRMRKRLGGDLHQAGIVAAAGIVAIERMVDRLALDHRHARRLAEGLAALPGLVIDLETVQTNTVVFRVADPRFTCARFLMAIAEQGVQMSEFRFGRIRAVTHYGISAADIDRVLEVVAEVLASQPVSR
jgi:threonine aldolase